MRISTPFLAVACVLLTIGSLLALISRCCHSHAAVLAALLFTLGGLSVSVGVVWFISVISEEFGTSQGRKTSWVGMYAYWYGWSLGAAGGAGIAALLAALLTAHAHVSRHKPHLSHLCEDTLQRPLLHCRSEGCLGGRSCTSDTLRTYLTSDSRKTCPGGRVCPHGQIVDRSPSVVDLTRSSIEGGTALRQEYHHQIQQTQQTQLTQEPGVSEANSDDEILSIVQQQHQPMQHYHEQTSYCSHSHQHKSDQITLHKVKHDQSKVQYHYKHQNSHRKHVKKASAKEDLPQTGSVLLQEDCKDATSQVIIETPLTNPVNIAVSAINATHYSSSTSSAASLTGGIQSQSLTQPISHHTHYQTSEIHPRHHSQPSFHPSLSHSYRSEQDCKSTKGDQSPEEQNTEHQVQLNLQSTVSSRLPSLCIPAMCPPPPSISTTLSSPTSPVVRHSSSEPPRLPQLNTFTSSSDYSKTLPLKEMRQMAVFSRANRSNTLSRPASKLSSEL